MTKEIKIFTDGSCLGDLGAGGFGAIIYYQDKKLELFQGYRNTTNNRMELMAVRAALSVLEGQVCNVVLTSDSQYLRNGITQWILAWKKNGWLTATRKPVKNVDLWQAIDQLAAPHQIDWRWVKGHAGHADNERCDELARDAAQSNDLLNDDTQLNFSFNQLNLHHA